MRYDPKEVAAAARRLHNGDHLNLDILLVASYALAIAEGPAFSHYPDLESDVIIHLVRRDPEVSDAKE